MIKSFYAKVPAWEIFKLRFNPLRSQPLYLFQLLHRVTHESAEKQCCNADGQ